MHLTTPKYGTKRHALLKYLQKHRQITKLIALQELKIQNLADQIMVLRRKGYLIGTSYRKIDNDLTIVVYHHYPNAKPNS